MTFSSDSQPTQPIRRSPTAPTRPQPGGQPRPGSGGQPPRRQKPDKAKRFAWLRAPWVAVALCLLAALLIVSSASAAVGWSEGRTIMHATATMQAGMYMLEQYNLAMEDMTAGRYDLARQRLEFIYQQNQRFLDTGVKLIEVLQILQNTPEAPTAAPFQASPTPTVDPRPKEQLLQAARQSFVTREWSAVIDALLALRKADPNYFTADVDGMLYAALRNRGVQHITQQGLFEPGLYDFSLAENFGPLDAQANNYRQWARLYLYGNAFWLAYPQDAAYYYGQLVGMAPDLRDAQGNSAFYRYWQSLVHWADSLATEDTWCEASEAYQQALAARNDAGLQPTAEYAYLECLGPSATPTATSTNTRTPTGYAEPTATETPAVPGTATMTETPTVTFTPAMTFTPSPTLTPEPPTATP
ncbi:MAG: hypothetical protein KIT70_09845 [Anaerolineales bacterium]|nr:MAG: hypothetical protein KIT70_09845 [Anaerolineales bacterium]